MYSIKAVEALAKSDLSHASYCVDQGHRWSRSDRFLPNPKARFSERARTGGKEKDARREPVKKKVAELLLKLAPEEGWSTTTAAVSAVTGELIDNDSSLVKECHLKTDNLPRVIAGWIEEDSERFPHRIKSKY